MKRLCNGCNAVEYNPDYDFKCPKCGFTYIAKRNVTPRDKRILKLKELLREVEAKADRTSSPKLASRYDLKAMKLKLTIANLRRGIETI